MPPAPQAIPPAQNTHSVSTAHLVPEAHPAHALLSVAHALLGPANTLAAPILPSPKPTTDLNILPIEEVNMPEEDVSDLRDVFEAINKLCETMRTSTYEDAEATDETEINVIEDVMEVVDTAEIANIVECDTELASPADVTVRIVDAYRAERWSDALISPPEEDTEQALAIAEPVSEMYYTASSEVSLLSDGEVPDKGEEDSVLQTQDKETRKEYVIAGHVAAMRERFESMTRANTPCPDLACSTSPSLDVFRNITPSPDLLG